MTTPTRTPDTRDIVLATIRRHLAASASADRGAHVHVGETAAGPIGDAVNAGIPPGSELVHRFQQAVEAVQGRCVVAHGHAEATAAVQSIVDRLEADRIVVSNSPLAQRITAGVRPCVVQFPDAAALFTADVGVTGAQWGIAETGTLVLDSDHERNRLASLVPPVHIAVLEADRIRATLADMLAALVEDGAGGLSRLLTLITGPSRTSDIELTLAIGVHGPAELHVIVVAEDSGGAGLV